MFEPEIQEGSTTPPVSASALPSVVSAETATEVGSSSAISSEEQSQSQNLQKELVWPEKEVWGDDWDPVAWLDSDKNSEIAIRRSMSSEINARCVPRCSVKYVVSFSSSGPVLAAKAFTGYQR